MRLQVSVRAHVLSPQLSAPIAIVTLSAVGVPHSHSHAMRSTSAPSSAAPRQPRRIFVLFRFRDALACLASLSLSALPSPSPVLNGRWRQWRTSQWPPRARTARGGRSRRRGELRGRHLSHDEVHQLLHPHDAARVAGVTEGAKASREVQLRLEVEHLLGSSGLIHAPQGGGLLEAAASSGWRAADMRCGGLSKAGCEEEGKARGRLRATAAFERLCCVAERCRWWPQATG